MSQHRLLQLAASIVLVMAVAVNGVGVRSAAAAKREEPFKASVSGTLEMLDGGSFKLNGSGQASFLGVVNPYYADGMITEFDDNGVPTADVLIETLTAANGDTLTIRCEQILNQVRPNVFRGTDEWEIIGGTGQFSGAKGSGTGSTSVDLSSYPYTFSKKLNGTFSLPSGE